MNMIARCPQCNTPFRVTPRQLKARGGKVRCGSCKAVFNGLENLLEDTEEPTPKSPSLAWPEHINAALTSRNLKDSDAAQQELPIAPTPTDDAPISATTAGPADSGLAETAPTDNPAAGDAPNVDVPAEATHVTAHTPDDLMLVAPDIELQFPAAPVAPQVAPAALDASSEIAPTYADATPPGAMPPNTPPATDAPSADAEGDAQSADASKTATDPATANDADEGATGPDSTSNSAREVRDVPGYNRWAETPLSIGHMQIGAPDAPRSPAIRALLAFLAVLFASVLGLQAAYVWRVDIAARWPDARPILEMACAEIHCSVPLPSEAKFVTIDASSLHIDPDRPGTVVLEATLRNSAAYAQTLPLLELTLTDAHDRPLARRVLRPADYLKQADAVAAGFAARSELPLRLWVDTDNLGAAGYRLYLFYAPAPLLASTSPAAR